MAVAKDTLRDSITSLTDWLRILTEVGMSLILVMIVIDVLFPGTTGVVKNLGLIVGQFSKEGLSGLIALLLFLLVFRNR